MNIYDLTIKEAIKIRNQINELFGSSAVTQCAPSKTHSFIIGKNYFIRTVTHHYTGLLISVTDSDIVLTDAAWIADDGRFKQAIAEGKFSEIEPYPDNLPVLINRGSLIDACEFLHPLPRTQK